MNAKKCDRCGCFYDPLEINLSFTLKMQIVTKTNNRYNRSIDMCQKCQDSLSKWFDNYGLLDKKEGGYNDKN